MFLETVLILTLSSWTALCCPENSVPPCTCSWVDNKASRIVCANVTNEMELERSLQSMRGIKAPIRSVKILDSVINYIPSEAFKGLVFPKLRIATTTMVSLSDTDTAFVGLEDSLEHLSVSDCEVFGGWDWGQLRNLASLSELRTRNAGVLEIDKDVEKIAHLNITDLFLTKDTISYIDDKAFEKFQNLVILSLKRNQIKELKRSMFPDPAPNFERLILNNNEIEFLPNDIFTNMPKMESILLSDNKLLTIDEDVFKPVWSHLRRIDFFGNPLECDCRLKWILEDPHPDSIFGTCAGPAPMKNTELLMMSPNDLWC